MPAISLRTGCGDGGFMRFVIVGSTNWILFDVPFSVLNGHLEQGVLESERPFTQFGFTFAGPTMTVCKLKHPFCTLAACSKTTGSSDQTDFRCPPADVNGMQVPDYQLSPGCGQNCGFVKPARPANNAQWQNVAVNSAQNQMNYPG